MKYVVNIRKTRQIILAHRKERRLDPDGFELFLRLRVGEARGGPDFVVFVQCLCKGTSDLARRAGDENALALDHGWESPE